MSPLSLPQKAAIVLIQLDEVRASAVLRSMSEADATTIMQEVALLPFMSEASVADVINELGDQALALTRVHQGGRETALRLLTDRFGSIRAQELLASMDTVVNDHPLAFMNQIDPQQIVSYTSREHPQTLAIVVAHLDKPNAARFMELLPDAHRSDVARRVAKMSALPPDVLRKVAVELESRLAAFIRGGSSGPDVGGIQTVVGILNNTDRATEKQILAELEASDPDVAEAIRNEMFVFDNLLELSDQDLQLVLRTVPVKSIALAAKGKGREVYERFHRNLSERNAQDLEEDFETLGAERASLVEAAEAELIKQARALAESGEINIERGDDELVA